jgi:flagellar biogenesis protein FliO
VKLPRKALIFGGIGLVALVISVVIPNKGDVGFYRQMLVVLALLLFLLMARELLLCTQGESKDKRGQITITGCQKLGPSSGICVVEVLDHVLVIGFTKEQIQLLCELPKKDSQKKETENDQG